MLTTEIHNFTVSASMVNFEAELAAIRCFINFKEILRNKTSFCSFKRARAYKITKGRQHNYMLQTYLLVLNVIKQYRW